MTLLHPSSVVRRLVAGATSGLILAGVLLPGAVVAAGGPPVPADDNIVTLQGVSAFGNVLANDRNNGGGTLTVTGYLPISAGVGTLTIASDGVYAFVPNPAYTGSTSTSYTVANDSRSRTGLINITVNSANHAPVANGDTLSLNEGVQANVTASILGNDTDADGNTITVTAVANATGGAVDLTAGVVTVTLDANACGTGAAGFDYDIADGNGGTASAHATIDVVCVNDLPVATADGGSGTEDEAVLLSAAALAANDSDIDSATLTVTGVSNATGGSVSLNGDEITFSPEANLCGTAAAGFDYTVEDGDGGTATGHVTLDLTCVNDNPAAAGDALNGTEDTDLVATGADLTGNDGDVDGDTLSVSGVSNAAGGSVALDAGTVTFTPAADACGDGIGSFDYELSDGNGATSAASVVVNSAASTTTPSPPTTTWPARRTRTSSCPPPTSRATTPMPTATRSPSPASPRPPAG